MNGLINYLNMKVSLIPSGIYKKEAEDAVGIKVSRLSDVLTEEQIKMVRRFVKPRKHECYKNATDMCVFFENLGMTYCEGYMSVCGCPVEHAFNKLGDRYIDVTMEMVLKRNPEETEYVVLGEYGLGKVMETCVERKMYGCVYQWDAWKQSLCIKP